MSAEVQSVVKERREKREKQIKDDAMFTFAASVSSLLKHKAPVDGSHKGSSTIGRKQHAGDKRKQQRQDPGFQQSFHQSGFMAPNAFAPMPFYQFPLGGTSVPPPAGGVPQQPPPIVAPAPPPTAAAAASGSFCTFCQPPKNKHAAHLCYRNPNSPAYRAPKSDRQQQ
jgi:hypothetical protein